METASPFPTQHLLAKNVSVQQQGRQFTQMSELNSFLEGQRREVPVPCKPVPAKQVDLHRIFGFRFSQSHIISNLPADHRARFTNVCESLK